MRLIDRCALWCGICSNYIYVLPFLTLHINLIKED